MTIETEDDVVALKRIGRIVSCVLQEMLDTAEPCMTTLELDAMGEHLLERHGARSAPRLTYVIGAAIQRTAKTHGFRIIENLGSHGVGRALHEALEHIPGYFDPTDKRRGPLAIAPFSNRRR